MLHIIKLCNFSGTTVDDQPYTLYIIKTYCFNSIMLISSSLALRFAAFQFPDRLSALGGKLIEFFPLITACHWGLYTQRLNTSCQIIICSVGGGERDFGKKKKDVPE